MVGNNCTSVTKEVIICSSLEHNNIIFDDKVFKVLDSLVPTFKDQYQTLRNIPIRTLCFIIERRDRFELIVDSLIGLKEAFNDYSKNIIIIITKTEKMTDLGKNMIKNYISEKTSFYNIIFTDKSTNEKNLLKFILFIRKIWKFFEDVQSKSREFLKYLKKL